MATDLQSMMANHFHFSSQAIILFSGWSTQTWAEILGSCVGVVVLAMLHEGLKVLRQYIDRMSEDTVMDVHSSRADDSGNHTPSDSGSKTTMNLVQHDHKQRIGMLRPSHWLQTLLYFIQLWISLCLMLVFMTFNVYLCLAVTVGGAVGYFFFAWIQRPAHRYLSITCH